MFACRRLNKTQLDHPQLKQLLKLRADLAANPPKGYERRTCLRVLNSHGSTYLYDFAAELAAPLPPTSESDAKTAAGSNDGPAAATTTEPAAEEAAAMAEVDSSGDKATGELAVAPPVPTSDPPKGEEPSPAEGEEAPATAEAPPPVPTQAPSSEPSPAATAADAAAAAAVTAEPPAGGEADNGPDSHVILDLPLSWLKTYGLIPGQGQINGVGESSSSGIGAGGVAAPSGPLRFYSWWLEDIESSDLTMRVTGNSEAGPYPSPPVPCPTVSPESHDG